MPIVGLLAVMLATTPAPAPIIPPALRSTVRVAGDCVIVRDLRGRDMRECLESGNFNSFSDFESFAGGRLVGYAYMQNEGFGYKLIDRANRGEESAVETGHKPVFSPNGRFFASAVSGSNVGYFRGIGLWSLRDDGIGRVFFTDAAHNLDWQIQSFPNDHCVLLATIPEASAEAPDQASPAQEAAPAEARTNYALTFGAEISLSESDTATCP